jgi:hypothetical protein
VGERQEAPSRHTSSLQAPPAAGDVPAAALTPVLQRMASDSQQAAAAAAMAAAAAAASPLVAAVTGQLPSPVRGASHRAAGGAAAEAPSWTEAASEPQHLLLLGQAAGSQQPAGAYNLQMPFSAALRAILQPQPLANGPAAGEGGAAWAPQLQYLQQQQQQQPQQRPTAGPLWFPASAAAAAATPFNPAGEGLKRCAAGCALHSEVCHSVLRIRPCPCLHTCHTYCHMHKHIPDRPSDTPSPQNHPNPRLPPPPPASRPRCAAGRPGLHHLQSRGAAGRHGCCHLTWPRPGPLPATHHPHRPCCDSCWWWWWWSSGQCASRVGCVWAGGAATRPTAAAAAGGLAGSALPCQRCSGSIRLGRRCWAAQWHFCCRQRRAATGCCRTGQGGSSLHAQTPGSSSSSSRWWFSQAPPSPIQQRL